MPWQKRAYDKYFLCLLLEFVPFCIVYYHKIIMLILFKIGFKSSKFRPNFDEYLHFFPLVSFHFIMEPNKQNTHHAYFQNYEWTVIKKKASIRRCCFPLLVLQCGGSVILSSYIYFFLSLYLYLSSFLYFVFRSRQSSPSLQHFLSMNAVNTFEKMN